jgi:hypothetical protein
MQTVNRQIITIDLKKPSLIQLPQFIQGDTNILEIIIKEDGVDADLNNIGRIVASYRRPDGEEFSRLLTSTDNIVVYKLGVEENEVKGYGEVDVKFFSSDNLERISTKRFKVSLAESIGTCIIYENNGELTLLQELFVEVESIKQSAENEDARIENESQRQDAEAERNTKEIERQLAETSRTEAESTRLTSEQTRETNEAIRQQQEAARQNNTAQIISEAQQAILNTEIVTQYATESGEYAVGKGNEAQALGLYAKQQGDRAQQIVDENKTIWLKPVATFAAIATTYPNPIFGSKVITMDDQKEYRFTTIWEWTGIYSSNGVTALQAQLADANRQTQNLQHGTSIFASALNSPIEFEVQGRTLISLGNSNLEPGKLYVQADKRTKIRAEGREGTLYNGVAKFTKSASLITKADFVGKVVGSNVENPHVHKIAGDSVLRAPSAFISEPGSSYVAISTLNSSVYYWNSSPARTTSGFYDQQLFSFNLIEHIERKHGRIPSDTVSGKVQWIRENVNRISAYWHGWGSSVGGNRASLKVWIGGSWLGSPSHTNGTVTRLVDTTALSVGNFLQSDGFVHYLAHSEPSDGTTPSQLNTDFIELEIELKSTAVLDTRPIITRVATFEGKVYQSTVENPHIAKANSISTSLQTPTGSWSEFTQNINSLNGVLKTDATATGVGTEGRYAQQLFSYNLIEEIERNIGRIPKATVAEKVQWLKDNVESVTWDWNGFGSSVGGNKATIVYWREDTSAWSFTTSHTSGTVAKLSTSTSSVSTRLVNSSGMVHALVYAEPSDGTTASTINTDFISLDITLKQGATLHDPVLPLFEVDATDYANILVSWDENAVQTRFPKVQGVQHLQNVAVIAEGENLLPPFSEWNLNANATIKTPYEFELNATAQYQQSWYEFSCLGGQTYHFSLPNLQSGMVWWYDTYDASGAKIVNSPSFSLTNRVINTESHARKLRITLSSSSPVVLGKFTFTNPMLTLGNTPKPFVPRNPSYLFAPVKLGQIGTVKDSLFKHDGNWQLVERVKKDVVLDGSTSLTHIESFAGFKRLQLSGTFMVSSNSAVVLTKYDGKVLKFGSTTTEIDTYNSRGGTPPFNIAMSASNTDTGFPDGHTPTTQDWQRYLQGWKYTDGTTWQSVTGNGQSTTAANALTTKPNDYTPYKLSYVLASPQTTNLNHLVEGDIAVSGQTQVQVTSGFTTTTDANGKKVYTFTLERNRYKETVNATEVKASYSGNFKEVVDDTVVKVSDLATQQSVLANQMYRVLVAAKGAGWNV